MHDVLKRQQSGRRMRLVRDRSHGHLTAVGRLIAVTLSTRLIAPSAFAEFDGGSCGPCCEPTGTLRYGPDNAIGLGSLVIG